MYGVPMQEAKKALIAALQRLTYQDRFTICAFDDRAEWFDTPSEGEARLRLYHAYIVDLYIMRILIDLFCSGSPPHLMNSDSNSIQHACQWVNSIEARGLTDILSPYKVATDMLLNADQQQKSGAKSWAVSPNTTTSNIPVIFLITDGAVKNEHEICTYAKHRAEEWEKKHPSKKAIRTFTYGIGPYVNQFFLKRLANDGRGYAHICLHESRIETTIIELMHKCYNPLLVNVALEISTSAGVQHVSPAICPDLFHGNMCPEIIYYVVFNFIDL